ncbi:AAA family ATPase [Ignavibacterium sp.]|uniref:AAA family ATPase n=1 Tax=Ignavibacterium sp. TaxID=2651167 RepID=UPI00307F8BCD
MITGQLKRIIELQSLQQESAAETNNICAVVSGKGGTGKTVFSVLLSDILSRKNRKVLLIDLDLNLANIHFLLNENPHKSLNDYFTHHEELQNIIKNYAENLHIIYGLNSYSISDIPFKSSLEKLLKDIQSLSEKYDLVILDLGAGLSEFTLKALKISAIKIILTVPEATSVMDAYAVIKMFENYDKPANFQVVMNRCLDKTDGNDSFAKLSRAVSGFLKSSVKFLAAISESKDIRQSVAEQDLLKDEVRTSKFTNEFLMAAEEIDKFIHLTNINQPSKSASSRTAKNISKSTLIL